MIATTDPNTTVESPSSTVLCRVHSIEAGDCATRGGLTVSLGSIVIARWAGSLASGSNAAELLLTASISGPCARLTTNSPVSSTLRNVSLAPTEVNWMIGGRAHETV